MKKGYIVIVVAILSIAGGAYVFLSGALDPALPPSVGSEEALDVVTSLQKLEEILAQGMILKAEGDAILNEADNGLRNTTGTIAMARMNQIDSARRQFFINVGNNKSLNHSRKSCSREDEAAVAAARAKGIRKPTTCKSFGYAVIGKVVSGMDIVDAIEMSETGTMGQYGDVPVTPITIMSMDRL